MIILYPLPTGHVVVRIVIVNFTITYTHGFGHHSRQIRYRITHIGNGVILGVSQPRPSPNWVEPQRSNFFEPPYTV